MAGGREREFLKKHKMSTLGEERTMTKLSGQRAKITAVFADADRGQREAIKLYASVQTEIDVLAVVPRGADVLELFRQGPRPDVLVVDALLPDMSIFELLSGLSRLCLKDPPAVVVSLYTPSDALRSKLLTYGTDFFILKPYRLPALFEAAACVACDTPSVLERRARSHINWYLEVLHAPADADGTAYLRRMLFELVVHDELATADELCRVMAEESRTTPNSISKSIGRSIREIWRQSTPEYVALCEYFGESTDKPLSNMKLVKGLASRIRWELNL